MIETLNRPLVIAGPCAAESRAQVVESAHMAKERGISHLRASLWKPRTRPGFDGVGEKGIQWLEEVALLGIIPATEVITSQHAESVVNAVSGKQNSDVLIWIGSRNQNHMVQQEIGQVVKGDKKSMLLVKNQPWEDAKHWLGIVDHVVHGGADPKQIVLCHRGFAPGKEGFRNSPNLKMAMEVKQKSGLRMVIDPSHMGGTTEKVLETMRLTKQFEKEHGIQFDGWMIEAQTTPSEAQTDADQQLTWQEFDQIREEVIFQK